MFFTKSVLEGLKYLECDCGIGGKNYPIHYIPQKDPIKDTFEKKVMTTYFKMTLPKSRNKQMVVASASGTPE